MYEQMIETLFTRPAAFAPTAHAFWDDPHIASNMLRAHLDPHLDAASRNHAFIEKSAQWIASLKKDGALLDLGCGPGLYAEALDALGFQVTGVDISENSLRYAEASARQKGKQIAYLRQSYLTLALESSFDAATLIYCDFGVLPPDDRKRLLCKVYRALKPGGMLILDAHSPRAYDAFEETRTVSMEEGGFFSSERHVLFKRQLKYAPSVLLTQYLVVTARDARTYNIWNEAMDAASLSRALHAAGFSSVSFYGDVSGRPCAACDQEICAVAYK